MYPISARRFVVTSNLVFLGLLSVAWVPRPSGVGDGFLRLGVTFVEEETADDCNSNGIPDAADISAGTSRDCNESGTPDECEVPHPYVALSPPLAPVVGAVPLTFTISSPLRAFSDVVLTFSFSANLNLSSESIAVDLNGVAVGTVFGFLDCPPAPETQLIVIPRRTYNAAVAGGNALLRMVPSSSVGTSCPASFIQVRVSYTGGSVPDCNANTVPDSCDIASATSIDCQTNGVPDECELVPGGFADEAFVILDCNGNATDDGCDIAFYLQSTDLDSNGIPDECGSQVCTALWDGFEPFPPFTADTVIDGLDYNNDGHSWSNPSTVFRIQNQGCPASTGKALKGIATSPPMFDLMDSEFFITRDGGDLECRAQRYSLSFDLRSEASLAPRIDWQILIRDATNDASVILIHLASTRSNFAGVNTAQGGDGRGRVLVQNPAAPATFINTLQAIPLNSCYRIRVELDNAAPSASAAKVFINDALRLTTARLDAAATRMDYLRVEQEVNGNPTTAIQRLGLDNLTLCRDGLAADWPDCNHDCVADNVDIALGFSEDCDAGGLPDECDAVLNCSCTSPPGASDDCTWCNHAHVWGFESSAPEAFSLGPIHGQRGWTVSPMGEADGTVVPSSLFPGQFEGERIVRLGATGFGSTGEGIISPIARSEDGAEAEVEFWEADVLLDAAVRDGEVHFVIWDPCTDSTDDFIDYPLTHFERTPFNAGVRFYFDGITRELRLFSGGSWHDKGANRAWVPGVKKHVTIRINNATGNVSYYAGPYSRGHTTPLRIWESAVESPLAGGDAQVLLLNISPTLNAYFDNLDYHRDNDCDRDNEPDSIYLSGIDYVGEFYQPEFDLNVNEALDWCEDCNANCVLDSLEIASGAAWDCNHNGIPDECDVDATLPLDRQLGCTPSGGKTPCTDYACVWSFYSRRGGGSADTDANGVPDECGAFGPPDCDGDGDVDEADYAGFPSCLAGPSGAAPAGCACYDTDDDADVDLVDAAALQRAFATE